MSAARGRSSRRLRPPRQGWTAAVVSRIVWSSKRLASQASRSSASPWSPSGLRPAWGSSRRARRRRHPTRSGAVGARAGRPQAVWSARGAPVVPVATSAEAQVAAPAVSAAPAGRLRAGRPPAPPRAAPPAPPAEARLDAVRIVPGVARRAGETTEYAAGPSASGPCTVTPGRRCRRRTSRPRSRCSSASRRSSRACSTWRPGSSRRATACGNPAGRGRGGDGRAAAAEQRGDSSRLSENTSGPRGRPGGGADEALAPRARADEDARRRGVQAGQDVRCAGSDRRRHWQYDGRSSCWRRDPTGRRRSNGSTCSGPHHK